MVGEENLKIEEAEAEGDSITDTEEMIIVTKIRKAYHQSIKEQKEVKEFKIDLGSTNSEKVKIPVFDDQSRQETMFILIERFNMMIDDGDLFKEETGDQ